MAAIDATAVAGMQPGTHHNRWLAQNAIDYGSDPLEMLIRAEEKGETIVLTGVLPWPYEGQSRVPYEPDPRYPDVDPEGDPPRLYVGPCTCCGGNKNPRRWCAVCAKPTGKAKPLPKDAKTKYVKAAGIKGGIGA